MTDKYDKETRSRMMSAIKSHGNRSTELRMIEVLKAGKLNGWRRNIPIYGKPDFVWPKEKVALFVDGCFWHGCSCRRAPKSNVEFWENKISYNIKHDKIVTRNLRNDGWSVVRIRECQIDKKRTMSRLKNILTKNISD